MKMKLAMRCQNGLRADSLLNHRSRRSNSVGLTVSMRGESDGSDAPGWAVLSAVVLNTFPIAIRLLAFSGTVVYSGCSLYQPLSSGRTRKRGFPGS